MGFLDKYFDADKAKEVRLVKPSKIFAEALRRASGSSFSHKVEYGIYYNIYAFYGVVDGVGTSTIVANTAMGLAEAGLTVCVIDTSILAPVQDVLLGTEEAVYNADKEVKHWDWYDMPFTRESVLHVSKYSHNISVLSFKGGRRGIVDYMSPNDSETLVTLAISALQSKFDLILIDCCHEMTSVNTACLQQAQQVIQVWNDSPVVVSNMEGFITNAITLSCPLDKMRYVVYNRLSKDAIGSLDSVLNQYRLKNIGTSYFSEELYLKIVTGKPLFRCESTDEMVIDYTEFIIRICCHILNIDLGEEKKDKGKITAQDITDGKVEGTVHKKLRDKAAEVAVTVDRNPMGNPDYSGVPSEEEPRLFEGDDFAPDGESSSELAAEAAYARDAMQYGGVMEEDDVQESELTDENGDGVPDIFQNPDKAGKKKRRGIFGRKG